MYSNYSCSCATKGIVWRSNFKSFASLRKFLNLSFLFSYSSTEVYSRNVLTAPFQFWTLPISSLKSSKSLKVTLKALPSRWRPRFSYSWYVP